MAITATEKPLEKIFTSDYRFVIPSFQRAYTWRQDNIRQLVEDVDDACAADPHGAYFLGSLILVRGHGSQYQVIDGQQRLVSLSIVFAALRDLEDDPELAAGLNALLLEQGDKLRGIVAEPRLTLRDRDAAFFRSSVQEGSLEALFDLREEDFDSNAQRNIARNAREAYDLLAAMDAAHRHDFAAYLVRRVMVVIVTTDDLAGAHRIFDVMNMRGVPLTASDVFKAKTVAALPEQTRDLYAARWDAIMDPLGDDPQRLEEFFESLHLILAYKPMCLQVLADFLGDVLEPRLAAGQAAAFVDDVLAPYARAWQMIAAPTQTTLPDDVVGWLVALDDYQSTEWKPVAMWALVHSIRNLGSPEAMVFARSGSHAAGAPAQDSAAPAAAGEPLELHDVARLLELLRALERAVGVDSLNRQGTQPRRRRASREIRGLDKGLTVAQAGGLSITDEDRRAALMHLRGELQTNPALKRALLIRANEQREGARIIRPRSLNALPLLPERVKAGSPFAAWPEAERDRWTDRIGNLVLTQANESQLAQLTTYAARRDRLLMSASSRRFPLTARLKDIAELTPATLEARQEETVRLLADFWDIRYDADRVDLAALSEEHLSQRTTARRPTSGRVTIAQVIAAGLLIPGETLVWERPRKGERWTVTVTPEGRLRLEDGSEYGTPTAAARAVGGRSAGLDVWKRTSDGRSLSDIWKAYRLRLR
ncbi:DUF262 domain-containing protein [Bifidobacterium pullorum subsp. saeculare]|uniref:DUF262 domain-containing protein n=1 Tax=Bifidobacterium pullorum subsp. saeculare TaxID=78257 RepID=A0A938WVF9_9BIFI|nr:DUF262 domain-containing protein [Bifidobacterium pullorum]MBM6699505.1 DUF262 domain-containing protein [Bifidobacterium pullorum subsp. saeculare]